MATSARPFAIVTGAWSGIGRELAKCCAAQGFDLLIAADRREVQEAAAELRSQNVTVDAAELDLSTIEGVEQL